MSRPAHFTHHRRSRSRFLEIIGIARPLLLLRAWPVVALSVGLVPLMVGYSLRSTLHQPLTAILLVPLFWACICQDRLARAVLVVVLVMGSHSALAILLSALEPAGAAEVLSGSQTFWEQTRNWIQTGEDPEYHLAVWLPQHLLLFAVVLVCGALTLGVVPFIRGVEQIDLMNFYVGRMVVQSDSPMVALALGWHPWSVLRSLACTVLVFASASWFLERVTGHSISSSQKHLRRFMLGTALAVADAIVKFCLAPMVREQLFNGLSPAAL